MSSSSGDTTAQVNKLAAMRGKAFKDIFYTVFDSQRDELHHLFRDNTAVLWNGKPVTGGLAGIAEFVKGLPPTKHDLHTADSQPVGVPAANDRSRSTSLLVATSGQVRYGIGVSGDAGSKHTFQHTILLDRDAAKTGPVDVAMGNQYYIVSLVVRTAPKQHHHR